jgi:maltose phosphorylase
MGISRFWSQRITFSEERGKYVMLGVTGPNEYENNINNNWYTNTIAVWCMNYTIEALDWVKANKKADYERIVSKTGFKEDETVRWKDICGKMHFPVVETEGVFAQQDGYMDKEQIMVDQLDPAQRPINQHWSWDRILRSCFIKQADTLQGIYLFEENYDTETIAKNFKFYEERTVHESSLSPCVHVVLAARIDQMQKAYELYLRTSRLDIDDYNHEAHEGLHITSMAGTWMSVVEGFGGKRVIDEQLVLNPQIPSNWNKFSFKVLWRGSQLKVSVDASSVVVNNESDVAANVSIYGNNYDVSAMSQVEVKRS